MENIFKLIKLAQSHDENGDYNSADISDEELENNYKKQQYKRNTIGRINAIYHMLKSLQEEYDKTSYESKLSNSDKKIYRAFVEIINIYEKHKKSSNSTEAKLEEDLLPAFRFLLDNKDYDYYPDNYSSYIYEMVLENLEKLASDLNIQMELDF